MGAPTAARVELADLILPKPSTYPLKINYPFRWSGLGFRLKHVIIPCEASCTATTTPAKAYALAAGVG